MLIATNAGAAEDQVYDNQSNSDNSIYLACELNKSSSKYKPGPHTIKDLLENKINLKLDKKKKKNLKRAFGSELRSKYSKERILDGTSDPSLEDIDKQFDFVSLKILDKANTNNKKTICQNSNSYLGSYSSSSYGCKAFEQDVKFYEWKEESYVSSYIKWDREYINRETLIYSDLHRTTINKSSVSRNKYYQCYISNLEELNKLSDNYKDYLKPFKKEWDRLVSEFLLKEEAIKDNNKI